MGTSHLTVCCQRPNDKSNQRTGSVTELCKMKALQILARVWSNTCSVSRLSWDRVIVRFLVFGLCNSTHVLRNRDSFGETVWRSRMAAASPRGTAQSWGVPPHPAPKGVWAERWEDALKQDTATSPGRSLGSAGRAALPAGDTAGRHSFWKELCSAECSEGILCPYLQHWHT